MGLGRVKEPSENSSGLPDAVGEVVADRDRQRIVATIDTTQDPPDADFDALTRLAASTFATPVSLVTVVGLDRQWFKSRLGTDIRETPIGVSFCAHAIAGRDEVMVVADATADPRFAGNALVTGDPHVRFYAGAAIVVAGQRIGTLCVLDNVARSDPSPEKIADLKRLASLAASLFVLKENARTGALARSALMREEKRGAVALAAASLASWAWNVRTGQAECDETLPPLFGLPAASHVDVRTIFRAIDRRDAKSVQERFRAAIEGNDDYLGEYRVNGFDPPRWVAARGRVVERDADGRPLMVVGVNFDITERKSAEERQRVLLRELNHRVKNTLATVQALATQTVRHARDPARFLEAFSARLQALGSAHGLLSDNEWRGIAMRELVRLEVMPFDNRAAPRIRISGPDVYLSPDQALGLGLALHELASNALKFGSLSVAGGWVQLDWTVTRSGVDRSLRLGWAEHGGPPVERPDREGFGSILIRRSLTKILRSEVSHEFQPDGVAAEIKFPLDDLPD
jgi:two-component sensor histidine kinase